MAYHNNSHLIGHYLELLKTVSQLVLVVSESYFPPHHVAAAHLEIIEGVHKL